jgi:hypothetical protein
VERPRSTVRGRGRPARARAPPPARHALHANSTRMHAVKFAVAARRRLELLRPPPRRRSPRAACLLLVAGH